MRTHTISLPGTYIVDRKDRGLACGSVDWTHSGQRAHVTVDVDILRDMAADAQQVSLIEKKRRSPVLVYLQRAAKVASKRLDAYIEENSL